MNILNDNIYNKFLKKFWITNFLNVLFAGKEIIPPSPNSLFKKCVSILYRKQIGRYTNADLKISLLVCFHIKTILWKFRILNPRNSRVIYPFHISHVRISQKAKGIILWTLRHNSFKRRQRYWQISNQHLCIFKFCFKKREKDRRKKHKIRYSPVPNCKRKRV